MSPGCLMAVNLQFLVNYGIFALAVTVLAGNNQKSKIMLQSKSVFDLDHSNNPVITLEVKSSDDMRDKVARRFIEELAHTSQWCEILPTGETSWIIYPIKPEELRKQAAYMIAKAGELEQKV